MNDVKMRNVMPAVANAIEILRLFESIESGSDAAVADCVYVHLHACAIQGCN